MTAMPIYSKTLKISFSRTKKALRLNFYVRHLGLKVYQVYSNADRRLIFCPLYGQIYSPIHLYGKHVEKSFSQHVLKTNGRNLQRMIKALKLCSYRQKFRGYLPLPLGYVQI